MKKILLVLLCLFLFNPSHAQVNGAAALLVLDQIDATISKQLQTIDNMATNAIGNTGNMVLSVSARLRKDINETVGNTDKMLRDNQMLLYNQVLNLSGDFNKLIEGNLKEADLITTKVTASLDNFIVKEKEPRIYQYDTQSFIKGYTANYTFKIKGKNFDQSDHITISANGKTYEPKQTSYNELVFQIDSADIIPVAQGLYYADAQILFQWKKGLFKKKMETKVPFIIPVLPLVIGEVTVFYDQPLPERKYADPISYSCSCGTGPSSWTGSKQKSSTNFNILPTGGKYIDPNTVTVLSWGQRYGGNYSFDYKTEQQIVGSISCQSDGKSKGGGGFSALTFSYKEYEIIYPVHKQQTATRAITSVNLVLFSLPQPVDNKRSTVSYARIKTYDNKELILTPNSPNKLFDLRLNPATDDVSVAWKN